MGAIVESFAENFRQTPVNIDNFYHKMSVVLNERIVLRVQRIVLNVAYVIVQLGVSLIYLLCKYNIIDICIIFTVTRSWLTYIHRLRTERLSSNATEFHFF